jgi:hypothetical protein
MSLDIQRNFKMNSDFWPQSRGPQPNPNQNNNFPSLMDTSDYRAQQNFPENNNVDMKEHLMPQSTADGSQNNFQQQQTNFQGIQGGQQQQPPPAASPGADVENESPEAKFNADKLVNEIQVSFILKDFY